MDPRDPRLRPPGARPDPLLLRPSTVARLLGLSPKVTRAMIARGELPSRRLAGRYMVPTAEFRAWLESLPGTSATEAVRRLAAKGLAAGCRPEVVETADDEGRDR